MDWPAVLLGFLVVEAGVAALLYRQGQETVAPGEAVVVERLGRFHRVLAPGKHFLIPLYDRVAARHALGPETLTLGPEAFGPEGRTSLRVTLVARVVDPREATYHVANWPLALTLLARASLNHRLGEAPDAGTETLARHLRTTLPAAVRRWGIALERCEVTGA